MNIWLCQTMLSWGLCALPGLMLGQSAAARALEFPPKETHADASSSQELRAAQGDLLRLPPLRDLIELAQKRDPTQRLTGKVIEQERVRQSMTKLRNWDFIVVQGAAVAGRRDVFAVNSDGTISTPTATLIDNTNLQGSVGIRLNPVQWLLNRKAGEISQLEQERLALQVEAGNTSLAATITQLYNMTQKSLDIMDIRADGAEILSANAEMAKRLFDQGAISLYEYAEISTKAVEASAKFQDAKGDFRLYYQLLMTQVYGRLP